MLRVGPASEGCCLRKLLSRRSAEKIGRFEVANGGTLAGFSGSTCLGRSEIGPGRAPTVKEARKSLAAKRCDSPIRVDNPPARRAGLRFEQGKILQNPTFFGWRTVLWRTKSWGLILASSGSKVLLEVCLRATPIPPGGAPSRGSGKLFYVSGKPRRVGGKLRRGGCFPRRECTRVRSRLSAPGRN